MRLLLASSDGESRGCYSGAGGGGGTATPPNPPPRRARPKTRGGGRSHPPHPPPVRGRSEARDRDRLRGLTRGQDHMHPELVAVQQSDLVVPRPPVPGALQPILPGGHHVPAVVGVARCPLIGAGE